MQKLMHLSNNGPFLSFLTNHAVSGHYPQRNSHPILMTVEARVDRLERIAKLFVEAGLRACAHMREIDEKFDMLVNMQMENQQKFFQNEDRFARQEKKLAKLSEKTDQRMTEMWEAHAITNRKLSELIDILKQRQNGNGHSINN